MYVFSYKHLQRKIRSECGEDVKSITETIVRRDKISYGYDSDKNLVLIIMREHKEIIFKNKDQHLMFQLKYGR